MMIKKIFNITDNPSAPPRTAGVTTGCDNTRCNRQKFCSDLLGNALAGHEKINE